MVSPSVLSQTTAQSQRTDNHQDLEPAISGQIMDLHYNKHHQTYITNLNNALKQQAEATSSSNLVQHLVLQQAIKFNAGGHVNHTLFWESMTPPLSAKAGPEGKLADAITARWDSLDNFKSAFEAVALGLQGSGWTWLVKDAESGNLELITSKDQDVVPAGKIPVLGLDMWEHAYYLQYFNNKKSYVQGWWAVVNWKVAEKRFEAGGLGDVYGSLAGLSSKL